MIIELSRSFAALDRQGWQRYHRAIEHLIHAHGQGWHLLSPGREVVNSIRESCELSFTQRQIVDHYIFEKISTLGGQARSADRTLLCFPDGVEMVSERVNQIPVRLGIFNDLTACGPSKLITENAEIDGVLLESIARMTGRRLGYMMNLKLELVHGGGGTTGACYQVACQSGRPAICVVDSDRKFAGCAVGQTARAVTQHDKNRSHEAIFSMALPVRELENIVPISVLLDVYSGNAGVLRNISPLVSYINLAKVQNVFPCESLQYLDLKIGLKKSDIAKMPSASQANFIRLVKHVCPAERNAEVYDDPNDHTILYPGIANNLLGRLVEFLRARGNNSAQFVQKLMASPCWTWLEELIRLILSFGAAGERIPVR